MTRRCGSGRCREDARDRALDRVLDDGIVKHDVRRFAAKCGSDPLRCARRAFINALAEHLTASDASTNPILIGGVGAGDGGIMISLVTPKFGGTPSAADCQGRGVSALAQQICGLPTAGTTLGFNNVAALQTAISALCQK